MTRFEREHDGDPYMTLVKAKGMQRVVLRFWHVGAARKKADREAQAEARRRLHQKLFPSDSAVVREPDGSTKHGQSCANSPIRWRFWPATTNRLSVMFLPWLDSEPSTKSTGSACPTGPLRRASSRVAGCFLDELYPRCQSKFGVDVGQVGLHGAA
jgi:hypothetical protein